MSTTPRLTVVVPVKNEAGNIAGLVAEIERACTPLAPFEVVYVDDGSTDATPAALDVARAGRPWWSRLAAGAVWTCGCRPGSPGSRWTRQGS